MLSNAQHIKLLIFVRRLLLVLPDVTDLKLNFARTVAFGGKGDASMAKKSMRYRCRKCTLVPTHLVETFDVGTNVGTPVFSIALKIISIVVKFWSAKTFNNYHGNRRCRVFGRNGQGRRIYY